MQSDIYLNPKIHLLTGIYADIAQKNFALTVLLPEKFFGNEMS
jgi:hypothetical protein